jgi:hypothetical protein
VYEAGESEDSSLRDSMRRLVCLPTIAVACLGLASSAWALDKPWFTRVPESHCPGSARPVSVELLVSTLRRNGFHVYPDPDLGCPPGSAAELANVLFSGPHENLGHSEEIVAREGDVFCDVRVRPLSRGIVARHPKRLYQFPLPDRTDIGAWFVLANVDCQVFTSESTRARIVSRFRHAMLGVQATL